MLRLGCLVLILATGVVQAANEQVQSVRLWAAPDSTRVVFDVSGAVQHRLFTLKNPDRLVLDLKGTKKASSLNQAIVAGGVVSGMRAATRNNHDLRLVLDLNAPVKPKSFTLKPNNQYGHRLVIDLFSTGSTVKRSPKKAHKRSKAGKLRELVIAIDAGHGGEDPGARGKHGAREKNVVLSIARKLATLIEKEPGMMPVLTRTGDYYIGLRKRIDKARKVRADLFISIHADAFKDRRVHGSSVYVLSQRGASSEMGRWLVARENSADLIGGVSLDDKDDLLAEVLLDLAQSATLEASAGVADNVLAELKKIGKVHKRNVQHAGFVVLKSPDIPSLLIETAFISNPDEERRLKNRHHQQKLAHGILKGVRRYYERHPVPGTILASRERLRGHTHTIRHGDTLSGIAQRYHVSQKSLRTANNMRTSRLLVGKKLTIPAKGS